MRIIRAFLDSYHKKYDTSTNNADAIAMFLGVLARIASLIFILCYFIKHY